MKSPFVSIIIPVYNGEKNLSQCISSVLNQSYKNFELIIIDNNSTDSTKEIIGEFQKDNKNIKYVFEEKIGRGYARNAGIAKAKGKAILMTDSDCIVPENWAEKMIKPIVKENELIVMGSENSPADNFWANNIQEDIEKFYEKSKERNYIRHLDTKNIAFDSRFIKKNKFDKELRALEDFELYIRIKNNAKIRFLENIRVNHYNKDNMKSILKSNLFKGYYLYKVYKIYKNKSESEPVLKSVSIKNNLIFLFHILKLMVKNPKKAFFKLIWEGSLRSGFIYSCLKSKKENSLNF